MSQLVAVLKSPKVSVPIVCVVGTLALAACLFANGIIDATHTAMFVLAVYVGSKIFMAGVAIWVLARHSTIFRRMYARMRGENTP